MKKKIYLYPVWLRIWHWLNAFFFVFLILTGLSLYYAGENEFLISFDNARLLHNISGIMVSIIFVFYVFMNIKSKNYKYYIPSLKNIIEKLYKQSRYYLYGVFKGEEHPYHVTKDQKFNPLQQLAYFAIMFFIFPIVIISGWFLFFPELAPEEILGMGGVWPMVIIHISLGFILSVFMFAHIYLATHGDTLISNFISMFTGYHDAHSDTENNESNDNESNKDNIKSA